MKLLAGLASLIVLIGCAALEQPKTTSTAAEADQMIGQEGSLPQKFQLHDVPHNRARQRGTDCAPDSLRMVLNYRGKAVEEGDVTSKLDEINAIRGRSGGTSFHQMLQIAVESYGLPGFIIGNCDLLSLKASIMSKWPPIIGYRSSGRTYHAVVAVGYDDKRRVMLVHDPNYVRTRRIRYYDLGGISDDSVQRLTCLVVLPRGSTEEDLRRGLEKYVPKEMVSELRILSMFPSRELDS